MSAPFITGLSTETKPMIDGADNGIEGNKRYSFVNSRNRNRKVIQLGGTLTTQYLGIDAPTVAPTASAGTGANLFYCYVYVNKTFQDIGALEDFKYIRSNQSPILTVASVSTAATAITPTLSTDPQVTHIWLYVCNSIAGPFVRLPTNYEVANTGSPTWTGVTAPDFDQYPIEQDNFTPDPCRVACEVNGFMLYGGFVPISTTASVTVGSYVVTGTFPDGVTGLYLRFNSDTAGGISSNGLHLCLWIDASTIHLINADRTTRVYDGPGDKVASACKIWRSSNTIQISKRYNQDFTPSLLDSDFLIIGPGPVTGIAKAAGSYAVRIHYNNHGRKTVTAADFTESVPPRIIQVSSAYAMANPRAYASAGGRIFYYDKDAGVIEDKGTTHVPMTLPVIPNLIKSLNSTTEDIAEMEYDESRNLLFLSCCPSGYTRSHYLIVYNLTTNTWNLWFMMPDVLSMRRFEDASTRAVTIKMGSSQGSVTVWPSVNFNEAAGSTSLFGNVAIADDSTHLQVAGTPFDVTGDKLKDRWVMVWDDTASIKTYQFARISDNTSSRLTCDIFIGNLSTTAFNPIPQTGWAYWVGPIQSILGPCWNFNSTPDTDGHTLDIGIATSGLGAQQNSSLELYRNFETAPAFGQSMVHPLYADGSPDPDHQTVKLGNLGSIEATGITGWRIVDNNEAPLSVKAVVRRVKAIQEALQSPQGNPNA